MYNFIEKTRALLNFILRSSWHVILSENIFLEFLIFVQDYGDVMIMTMMMTPDIIWTNHGITYWHYIYAPLGLGELNYPCALLKVIS